MQTCILVVFRELRWVTGLHSP